MCLLFDHNISLSAPALFSWLSFTLWIKSKFYKRSLISVSMLTNVHAHVSVLSISISPSHLTLTLAVQASCWFWYIATLESQRHDTRSFLIWKAPPRLPCTSSVMGLKTHQKYCCLYDVGTLYPLCFCFSSLVFTKNLRSIMVYFCVFLFFSFQTGM